MSHTDDRVSRYRESVIGAFIWDCIEGPTGMNSFEEHEMVIWHLPERVAVADWIIRCLASPSDDARAVVDAIIAERDRTAAANDA